MIGVGILLVLCQIDNGFCRILSRYRINNFKNKELG